MSSSWNSCMRGEFLLTVNSSNVGRLDLQRLSKITIAQCVVLLARLCLRGGGGRISDIWSVQYNRTARQFVNVHSFDWASACVSGFRVNWRARTHGCYGLYAKCRHAACNVCMYVYMYVMYVCVRAFMHICMCVCVCLCVCMHV